MERGWGRTLSRASGDALLVLSIRVIASRSFWSRPWRDGHPAKANWPLDPALHSLRGLSLSVITASSSL